MSTSAPSFSSAIPVPEERRMTFLPRLFGPRLLIIGERAVFGFLEKLSPTDYNGGMWDVYELACDPRSSRNTPRSRLAMLLI